MKTLRCIGMALVAITLTFGLASCGGDDDDEPTPSGGETETNGTTPYGVEAVDMGLPSGTKWANKNIGAQLGIHDYGYYFAWGETVPCSMVDKSNEHNYKQTGSYAKGIYNWTTYKYSQGDDWGADETKYCTDSYYGTEDGKTELELADDAAYINWGKEWRMPTKEQYNELWSNTTSQWVEKNGVYGKEVTSKINGNSIFFPAVGYLAGTEQKQAGTYGYYWSSTLDEYCNKACSLVLDKSSFYTGGVLFRCQGLPIRPVQAK